jgi:GT2 family glycosyltransferase
MLKNWRDYWIIKKSGLFDPIYYLMNNPDVRRADVDPLMHFVKYGWKENRNPSIEFNVRAYLENYPDVKMTNRNPFVHYLRYGRKEGRSPLSIKLANYPLTEKGNEFFVKQSQQNLHDLVGLMILENQQKEINAEIALSKINDFHYTPLISIIMPIFNPELKWLIKAVRTIQSQYYSKWELCITDDGSSERTGIDFIKQVSSRDNRIKLYCREENGGISAASNDSLKFATGDYVALMDQDDEITPDALFWVVEALQNDPKIDFIYSDECKIDTNEDVKYSEFFFKPDWSPEMMINFMYTGHLSVYKKNLVDEIGGFRSEFDFAQDYDLALRVSEKATRIHHIERVLYFWRKLPGSGSIGDKRHSIVPTMLALKSHYKRLGVDVLVTNRVFGRTIQLIDRPAIKISIIIPTDDESKIMDFIPTLLTKTTYPNFEIVIVTNNELSKKIESQFPYYIGDILKVVLYDNKSFNFSEKCNLGSSAASGEVLVFLNDDAVPSQSDWLEPMLDLLLLPGVGGVSPLMVYEDGRVQYAGIQAGQHVNGLFGPSFHLMQADDNENMIVNPMLIRNVTVLSGACLMIRKSIFEEVGRFDAVNTPNGHSDVDLSLRIWKAGYRCVYTPFSKISHPGSGTWNALDEHDRANLYILTHWKDHVTKDHYFTKSMRRYNLHTLDLPFEFHLPENWDSPKNSKGTILIISHELSQTGAPMVVATTARTLKNQGFFVIVASFKEGPVLYDILSDDIPVVIDQNLANYRWRLPDEVPQVISHSFKSVMYEFDLVIINSFVCHNIVNCYNGTTVPIIWWLHEGRTSFENGTYRYMPKKLGNNIHVLCVGKYVQNTLKKFGINYESEILLYGVEDTYTPLREKLTEKVRFIFPGSFEKRKNQKLLFEAIQLLSEEAKEKSEFICIGPYWDQTFYDQLKQQAEKIKNLTLLEPIPHDKLMDLYDTCDCVVVPSIDDPMPVVLTEGMMLSKILLCSNMTGTAYYIKDGVNGYIFDCNDAKTLAEKLEFIIRYRDQHDDMKREARKLYEEHFSMAAFTENLLLKVNDCITPKLEEHNNKNMPLN